jgi:CRP/FNR family transcriptional regulator, anaerobic regulatory protein
MKTITIHPEKLGHSACKDCGIRKMALFADLADTDLDIIQTPIEDLGFAPHASIYTQGSEARYLYSIHSGLIKLTHYNPDGSQRILRVLGGGSVIGLEATLENRYHHTATAVGNVRACRIPAELIDTLLDRSPNLHRRLLAQWGVALRESEAWFAELNTGASRQRVAKLLLKMRDPDAPQFSMLFKREDMGAMLDITLETASRVVSAFIREGLIQRPADPHGQVEILNLLGLQAVADGL